MVTRNETLSNKFGRFLFSSIILITTIKNDINIYSLNVNSEGDSNELSNDIFIYVKTYGQVLKSIFFRMIEKNNLFRILSRFKKKKIGFIYEILSIKEQQLFIGFAIFGTLGDWVIISNKVSIQILFLNLFKILTSIKGLATAISVTIPNYPEVDDVLKRKGGDKGHLEV
ncbi:hypothetical protein BpHYR1_035477 [Brachionus plicatilis]|uniref:Uncharacterized protein n=1 Tax=Brachionus plicatilis TaxID=10195 RepID=A0A3M7RRA8_BRAPC|nr:hypothetical protein BpHYR1_035477 [Brachionus plicatilis]